MPRGSASPADLAEQQRRNREARRVRNLAPAYWIDHLVRTGEVADQATVARTCEVRRARVTSLTGMLAATPPQHESLLKSVE